MIKALLKKMRKSKKGFTLIELIVVIAILAILAAILIPSVTSMITTAKTQTDAANANTAYMAAQIAANSKIATGTPYAATDAAAAITAAENNLQNLKGHITAITFKADGTIDTITFNPGNGDKFLVYDGKDATPVT